MLITIIVQIIGFTVNSQFTKLEGLLFAWSRGKNAQLIDNIDWPSAIPYVNTMLKWNGIHAVKVSLKFYTVSTMDFLVITPNEVRFYGAVFYSIKVS